MTKDERTDLDKALMEVMVRLGQVRNALAVMEVDDEDEDEEDEYEYDEEEVA